MSSANREAGAPSIARERLRRWFALSVLPITAMYLGWRLTTINPSAPVVSWLFYLLELGSLVVVGLFVHATWDPYARPHRLGLHPQGTVVVLIPSLDEPEAILLPTVAAAIRIEGADRVVLIDGGDRPWAKAMASALGVDYMPFADGVGGKAGALNTAIATYDPDFMLVLDADHVAMPHILTRLLPYFTDPEVALVQSPQAFSNTGSFEHFGDYDEQEVFFRVMQPAKDAYNAAFWCGTGAVLRVAALRDVGGVVTGTLTEDIHTTIRLHRRGWRTAYHNEVLARGLAPADAQQYATQRLRWGRGAMEMLRMERPFLRRGLTLDQQLSYASAALYWMESWRTLGYLLLPVAVVVTLGAPVDAPMTQFLPAFATVFVLQQIVFRTMARGTVRLLPSGLLQVLRLPWTLVATLQLVWNRRGRTFEVTRKGGAPTHSRVRPPLLLTGLLLTFLGAAVVHVLRELTGAHGQHLLPARAAMWWLVLNGVLVALGVLRVQSSRFMSDVRDAARLTAAAPAHVQGTLVMVEDLSLGGARLSTGDAALPGCGTLDLPVDEGIVPLRFRTVRWSPGRQAVAFEEGQWLEKARLARALHLGSGLRQDLRTAQQA